MTSLAEEFFRLHKAPFSFERDRGPVLMTESLRHAAQFLSDGLRKQTPILGVFGGAGIGKSSLFRAIPKMVGEEWRVARLSGHAKTWDDFGPTLAREFKIDAQRVTRDELEAAHDKVGKPLIVVDDAQFLSAALLERICILPQLLTSFGEPVVQVVLLADLDSVRIDGVRPLLAWIDANARYEMEPIPLADVHRFIDTSLRRAGWEGHPLVCEAGASAIHRYSLGNPRQLGLACMDVFEQAATRGLKRIDAEFVVEALSVNRTNVLHAPLLAAPGTPLCEEFSFDLNEAKDDFPFATIPLTAENIAESDSLELEDAALEAEYRAHGYPIAGQMSALSDSTHGTLRSNSRPKFPALRPNHRTHGNRSFAPWALAIVAVLTLYAARTEVADLLEQIGLKLPFAAQSVGVVESPETTLQDALSMRRGDVEAGVTVGVPNESAEHAYAIAITTRFTANS